MNFQTTIKNSRTKLNLTQKQVADKIFVSQKSISNWENGRTYPDLDSLIRLAHLYELSLDDLLLTGSNLVKDLKIKHELRTLNHLALALIATISSLGIVLVGQKWWGFLANPIQLILTLTLILNLGPLGYFTWRKNRLTKQLLPVELTRTAQLRQIISLLLIVGIGCLLILSIPRLMKP